MEKKKQAYMIPIHEAFFSYERKNCTFTVHSHFCGWDSIIPKLQELMEDELFEEGSEDEISS